MSDLITHTARLVPYVKRPKQVASFVTAYSYEPLADEPGADLGNLYAVMEVLVSGRASEEVADLVIETIGDRYYNDPSTSSSPVERFEAAIKATNHELSEHVNRGNAAWIGKLSAIVAIQVGQELHAAQTGSAEAFLYRGKAATQISAGGPSRPTTPNKTFGSIATGQLEPGDRLLLATPALIHQVPLTRLQSIISQSSPNSAIAEITGLLKDVSIDRIAGLVIEITTPELAALQVRSEQPSEIHLGSPENALEAAKMAATPLAQTTVSSSKKVVRVAHSGIRRAQPHAKAASLAVADMLRQALSTSRGRKQAAALIIVVIIATLTASFIHGESASSSLYFNKYQTAYNNFVAAQHLLDNGGKTDARDAFQNVRQQLDSLSPHRSQIDAKLKHSALPEQEPRSFASLQSVVNDRIDQIDGLVRTQPITVASFNAKGARTDHFEVNAGSAYVFDSGNANALSIVNLATGSVKPSAANLSKLGHIVATTLSGTSDGIYILTDKPSVWFYRFDNDTAGVQNLSYGQWPKATAIASYANNLYLLGDASVYKSSKNAAGFSPNTQYISTTSEESRDATSLAVDGFVYLLSRSGLHRYTSAVLKQSAPLPDNQDSITNVRSTNSGNDIIGTDVGTGKIAIWAASPASLQFSKQLAVSGVKKLYDSTYDSNSGNVFALADNRLVRMPVQL